MARFTGKKAKETPALNMGSMSDIIFMLLFFFMVITTMRESSLYVQIKPPQGTEVTKLEKKSLVSYINVGVPMLDQQKKYGTEPRIQLSLRRERARTARRSRPPPHHHGHQSRPKGAHGYDY